MRGITVVIFRCLLSTLRGRNAVSNSEDFSTRFVRRNIVPILDEFAAVQYEPVSGKLRDRRLVIMVSMLGRSHAANDADPERGDERGVRVPVSRSTIAIE